MASDGPWIEQFPGNFVWSNAALVTKGMAPYGAVALGEIDAVCERLKGREGDPGAWPDEWSAMASRLEKVADQAAAEGRHFTAATTICAQGCITSRPSASWSRASTSARSDASRCTASRQGSAGVIRTSSASRFLTKG